MRTILALATGICSTLMLVSCSSSPAPLQAPSAIAPSGFGEEDLYMSGVYVSEPGAATCLNDSPRRCFHVRINSTACGEDAKFVLLSITERAKGGRELESYQRLFGGGENNLVVWDSQAWAQPQIDHVTVDAAACSGGL